MDAAALRARQRPLKDQYREDPATAVVVANAVAEVDVASVSCVVDYGTESLVSGLHPATGGEGGQACSADLLLGALAACAGTTLAAVATAMGVDLGNVRVRVSGHWDARGTLGVDRSAPVGLTDITLTIETDSNADDATLERLTMLTERYCVIAQTLVNPPHVNLSLARA